MQNVIHEKTKTEIHCLNPCLRKFWCNDKSVLNIPNELWKCQFLEETERFFVCVEYFAHKARLPAGWCVDTNLTPQFSSTKEPVLQKNGEYIRLKNISRQQKQIFSEYLSVCAISGGIRGNGLNLVGRIFSTSYKKEEEGEFFCHIFIICALKKMNPKLFQIF